MQFPVPQPVIPSWLLTEYSNLRTQNSKMGEVLWLAQIHSRMGRMSQALTQPGSPTPWLSVFSLLSNSCVLPVDGVKLVHTVCVCWRRRGACQVSPPRGSKSPQFPMKPIGVKDAHWLAGSNQQSYMTKQSIRTFLWAVERQQICITKIYPVAIQLTAFTSSVKITEGNKYVTGMEGSC